MKLRTVSLVSVLQLKIAKKAFCLMDFHARFNKPKHWMECLLSMGRSIDHVVNLKVDRGLLLARLTGRRICKSCGATYHVMFNPPKQLDFVINAAASCISGQTIRKIKLVLVLMNTSSKTAPLLDYYTSKGILTRSRR